MEKYEYCVVERMRNGYPLAIFYGPNEVSYKEVRNFRENFKISFESWKQIVPRERCYVQNYLADSFFSYLLAKGWEWWSSVEEIYLEGASRQRAIFRKLKK